MTPTEQKHKSEQKEKKKMNENRLKHSSLKQIIKVNGFLSQAIASNKLNIIRMQTVIQFEMKQKKKTKTKRAKANDGNGDAIYLLNGWMCEKMWNTLAMKNETKASISIRRKKVVLQID